MPTLKVEITAVTDDGSGLGTGTYSKVSGPGSVSADGDINLAGVAAAVDVEWTISASGYKFRDPGCDAPPIQQFDPPTNSNGDLTCTIDDRDDDLSFKYSLYLENSNGDAITLDPRMVNR